MNTSAKVIYWLPRIICILAILFISLFAADAFDHGENIWQKIGDFLMHLVPSFILLVFLVVAWKWELIGGIIFVIIGIVFSPFIFMHNYKMNDSIGISLGTIMLITFPFIVVGVLFLLSYWFKKKQLKKV